MSCLRGNLFKINKIHVFLHVLYGENVLRQDKRRLFLVRQYSYKATLSEGLLYATKRGGIQCRPSLLHTIKVMTKSLSS